MSLSFRRIATAASFCSLGLALTASGARAEVVISQLFPGGGAATATYSYDYIELYNNGTSAVSLLGDSLQYASATGTTVATVFNLTGTIAPKNYFLVETGTKGTGGGAATPGADLTGGSLNMAAQAGKVFLANDTVKATFVAGANTTATLSSNVLDFVGYGGAGNVSAYFGSAPAVAPGATGLNTNSIFRALAGTSYTNTQNNGSDFSAGAVALHNSAGPVVPGASATPEPGSLALAGMGALSLMGAFVRRRRAK